MRPSVLSPPGTDPALRRCDCFRGIDCKGPAPGPCACVRRSRGRVPASHGRHPDVVLLGLRNGWARHQDACRTPAPGGTDRTPAASRIVTSPLPEPAAARERRAVSVAGGKMGSGPNLVKVPASHSATRRVLLIVRCIICGTTTLLTGAYAGGRPRKRRLRVDQSPMNRM